MAHIEVSNLLKENGNKSYPRHRVLPRLAPKIEKFEKFESRVDFLKPNEWRKNVAEKLIDLLLYYHYPLDFSIDSGEIFLFSEDETEECLTIAAQIAASFLSLGERFFVDPYTKILAYTPDRFSMFDHRVFLTDFSSDGAVFFKAFATLCKRQQFTLKAPKGNHTFFPVDADGGIFRKFGHWASTVNFPGAQDYMAMRLFNDQPDLCASYKMFNDAFNTLKLKYPALFKQLDAFSVVDGYDARKYIPKPPQPLKGIRGAYQRLGAWPSKNLPDFD